MMEMALQRNLALCIALVTVLHTSALSLETTKDNGGDCHSARAAKAETYLDTAAALIDKLRDHMPEGGQGDCSCPKRPTDCDEILQCGYNRSGVFEIWPRNRIITGSITVYCDLEEHGGGWTVLQRRGDFRRPADFFNKNWLKYKNGFGDVRRDFWLGNDNIHALTNQKKYYLRIDMVDFANHTNYALYDEFWIDNENQHYKLHVHEYSGDAGDSLFRGHDGQKFSTYDRDNDSSASNCAQKHKGGWWFNDCLTSNLNGLYNGEKVKSTDGVIWSTWKGPTESLKFTVMKVRPIDFKEPFLDLGIDAV